MRHPIFSAIRSAFSAACCATAVIFSASNLIVAPAFAQAATTPAPAAVANYSATHLEAAKQMLIASGIGKSIAGVLPEILDQAQKSITATRPELISDLMKIIKDFQPEIDKKNTEIMLIASKIVAGQLTEAELKDVLAFFSSPIGQKYVSSQPKILEGIVPAMQNWSGQTGEIFYNRMREELIKKGHQL